MKGKVIVSRFWTRFFSLGKAEAITLFPFIFIYKKGLRKDIILLNHERIHICQALELFVVGFYLWYVLEFLFRFLRHKNFDKAYRNISFEREAFAHESNIGYLKQRKRWAFRKYL